MKIGIRRNITAFPPRSGLGGGVGGGVPSGDISFLYVGDLHYSDKADGPQRHYRDGKDKLQDAVDLANSEGVNFIIMHGDYIDHDGGIEQDALDDLAEIEGVYESANMQRLYSLGNHDLDALSKSQFISNTGMTDEFYYEDIGDYRIIVLDACYRSDDDDDPYDSGNFDYEVTYIPPDQRSWLQNTALDTDRSCIVFCHQLLMEPSDHDLSNHTVLNASTVRGILEAAGNVIAVFSGHGHNNYRSVENGILYHGMMATVEFDYPAVAHALVSVKDDVVLVNGVGRQGSYRGPIHTGHATLGSKIRGWFRADTLIQSDGLRFGSATAYNPELWRDIRGFSPRNASQAASGDQPIMERPGINGLPALRFANVSGHHLPIDTGIIPTGSAQYELFVVLKTTQAAGVDRVVLFFGDNATNEAINIKIHTDYRLNTGWWNNNLFSANNAVSQGVWSIVESRFDGTGRTQLVDGASAGNDIETAKNTASFDAVIGAQIVGSEPTLYWEGSIAEIIVADALSSQERDDIRAYLAEEYGITVS